MEKTEILELIKSVDVNNVKETVKSLLALRERVEELTEEEMQEIDNALEEKFSNISDDLNEEYNKEVFDLLEKDQQK
mgnify:CR=1 FL=1